MRESAARSRPLRASHWNADLLPQRHGPLDPGLRRSQRECPGPDRGWAANEDATIAQGGELAWVAATPVGEPNSAAWPTTGTYRYQIDCIAAGVDLTFGLLTQATYTGGFVRINSALDTELQLFAQSQSAFSGSGLHLATVTDPAWSAGAASDRFAIKIAGVRVIGHGNQIMTLQLGEVDDYADGPWPEGGVVAENATFFGSNF